MDWLEYIVKPILTGLLLYLTYFFLKPSKSASNDIRIVSIETLFKKYKRRDNIANVRFVVAWIVLALLIGYIFNLLYSVLIIRKDLSYFSPVSPGLFYISAFLVAIYPAYRFYLSGLKQMIDFDLNEFKHYYALRYHLDFDKGYKYFALPLIIIGIIVLIFSFDTYSYKEKETFVYNPFFGFEQQYTCADISIIVYYEKIIAPNGDKKDEETYRIYFTDGNEWYSRMNGYEEMDDFDFVEEFAEECDLEILEEESTSAY